MIAMVMIIVSIRLAAQAPGDGIVGVARHDIARGGLRNQAIRVLLKQESLADLVLGGMPHYAVVSLLAPVALLDGAARIAARQALGFGHGKRNVAGRQRAFVALQGSARDRVPARVGSQRRLQEHGFHACDLIAVLVHLGGGCRNNLFDRRNDVGHHPRLIVVPEVRTVVIVHEDVHDIVGRRSAGDFWPVHCVCGRGTRVPSLTRGYSLGGGCLPLVTQSTRATSNARRVSVWGFGFSASINPGCGGCATAKPPSPPPCVVLAL